MKVMILSDTHGLVEEVKEVKETIKPQKIIHCGDFCVPSDQPPFDQMVKVHGNCDYAPGVPLNKTLQWEGLKIWITHGHKWRVKESLLHLSYQAETLDAHVILFGHSHFPVAIQENGRLFINPGSLSKPRGYLHPTFVVMEVEQQGRCIHFDVQFLNRKLQKMNDRGGHFQIDI